ncbi:integrase [Saccharothrix sp. ALI-22-I]|uniref:tyrosine-type recombinase/integrase n=1 Tax=Saccharothrix sp. ALI-22-I TaxID=1933778 RepID=UPI00097CB031|nr:site-specific integrase [Saccharothrix sp. ALI-22-I]ONI92652.1 integrase [Saccharothrix sp. ALI-22-I]
MTTESQPSDSDLEKARQVLALLGVSPEALVASQPARPAREVPTFTDWVPVVSGLVGEGTRKLYSTYWNKLVALWPQRRLDELPASDLTWLFGHVRQTGVRRRNWRGGHSAAEHMFSATRCLYKFAVDDGLITAAQDPTRKVKKPKRAVPTRRGLNNMVLEAITAAASTTGDDPALDALLIRLHVETAARRGGALALTLDDLDREQCLVRLHEKGELSRWQPVSPTLMTHLVDHAHHRGAREPTSKVLRYHNGKPLTYRRYDGLWERLREHVEPVRTQNISTHWLRHTTLKWAERNFGEAVARAYAGHRPNTDSKTGAIAIYVKADLEEVATALAALTGEPHPLAADTPTELFDNGD